MSDVHSEPAAGNQIIDQAATTAGRDPRQSRRIFDFHGSFTNAGQGYAQGQPEQWVQQLLPLVTEHGVSTFILIGNDPDAIERRGTEAAPALRTAAEQEREALPWLSFYDALA